MRVFLDTNVLVAAFATRGLCSDVLRTVLAEHDLLLTGTVSRELARALAEKLHLSEAVIREITTFLRSSASFTEAPRSKPAREVRDPDDAVILGEAVALAADMVVTGDRDLLDVADRVSIPIFDPRGFWERIRREEA